MNLKVNQSGFKKVSTLRNCTNPSRPATDLLFTKSSDIQIKNTLGVKKVQGQSEAVVQVASYM